MSLSKLAGFWSKSPEFPWKHLQTVREFRRSAWLDLCNKKLIEYHDDMEYAEHPRGFLGWHEMGLCENWVLQTWWLINVDHHLPYWHCHCYPQFSDKPILIRSMPQKRTTCNCTSSSEWIYVYIYIHITIVVGLMSQLIGVYTHAHAYINL